MSQPISPAQFVGDVPKFYDRNLGPVIFEPYAQDMARRVAPLGAKSLLEVAAGSGIVTRRMLEALSPDATLVATDLNQAMVDYATANVKHDPRLLLRTA